jgi:PAS domain S-box-containing protein
MFIIDLVYNLSTLVALSIISGFVDQRWQSTTKPGAILQGLLFGCVAMLGMINPLVFEPGLVFDGRSVVISLAGLFFGPVAGVISAAMAVGLRVFQGGMGVVTGVSVISASFLIGVLYHYIRKKRNRRISSLFLLRFGLTVHIVMLGLMFTLPYNSAIAVINRLGIAIVVFYPLATILIGKILHDQELKMLSVKALRKSEMLFKSLAISSPLGICKINKEGNIKFVNDRWCEIVSRSEKDSLGKRFSFFVHPSDFSKTENALNNLLNNGADFNIEIQVSSQDGNSSWVIAQFEPDLDEYGTLFGYVGTLVDISERKKTEDELRRWETIFKSTRVGIVLANGYSQVFDLMNPAFAAMHGYTIDELVGKSIDIVFSPEERSRIPEEIQKSYDTGHNVYESWHKKKDGTRFPVLTSVTAVSNDQGEPLYRIVNVQDVSSKYESERQLRNERFRLTSIIEGTNVGTWEWNVQSGHTYYNDLWAKMLGYTLEDVQPASVETWYKFVHPDDIEPAMNEIKRHFDGEIEFYKFQYRMHHKDGHWIWVQDRGKVTQWTDDGKPFMMFGTHVDITDQKKWEEVLQESEQKLKIQNEEYLALNEELIEINKKLVESEYRLKEQNEEYLVLNEELTESNNKIQAINLELELAKRKAEESDNLKTAFLANMSHEIRTPMNAIVGFSEILLRPNLTREKQTLYAEVLNASCGQLLNIINDVLDISKIETGQVTLHEGEVNLNLIINNVKSLFLNNARNKGNVIEFNPPLSNNACAIFGDEPKLIQIISNLVSNAIKFTENGEVEVGYAIANGDLTVYVRDTGIGISPENHELVFKRFRQVDSTANRNYGGTGLGLSISKAFIELFGGTIKVDSELGKGATFSFTIPYRPVKKVGIIPDAKVGRAYDFSKSVVLVAEDEPANFFYLSELLSETKISIIHVTNGESAVQEVQKNKDIDLVLMDIKMPIMNGIDATKLIRETNHKTPIIALTAYAMSGDKETCLDAGCNWYISKPISKDDLMAIMEMYLKK